MSEEYLNSDQWLPWFMKDFHAQKDLFKTIQQMWPNDKVNWVDAHVYTVDRFLRFMALHGYTLQATRMRRSKKAALHIRSIQFTLEQAWQVRQDQMAAVLNSAIVESGER